jgi:tRNA threonylcarbamoyladenosine biosynthesis protein TsaB
MQIEIDFRFADFDFGFGFWPPLPSCLPGDSVPHLPRMKRPNNTLVIDASGSGLFAGLLNGRNTWEATAHRESAALEGLFPAVGELLQKAELPLSAVDGFIYCEGPGSVLSLRLCAMAIETWRRLRPTPAPLLKYNSLQLMAHQLLADTPNLADARIVSDWKKTAWNACALRAGRVGVVEVLDDATLAAWSGPLYHLPQRKGWQAPPPGATTLQYDPSCLDRLHERPGLLVPTDSVELYNAGVNTFQKWTPTRHRAPTPH